MKECYHCDHWLGINGDDAVIGVCRRFPPVPVMLGMQQSGMIGPDGKPVAPQPVIRGAFPTSGRHDTCGEFEPKHDRKAN